MDPENEEEALLDPSNEPDDVTEDALEETDEWGNPAGTEYDNDGTPILDEEPEPEEPPTAAPARTPPPSLTIAPILSAEERAYAEEINTPQQLQLIETMVQRGIAAAMQSFTVANSAVDTSLSDASPDYRRMVVPQINAVFARMTPQQRADPHAADDALAVVMSEEARQTNEPLMVVMARHLQMRGDTTPAKRPAVAVRPPATRAPAPSSAGRGPVVRGRNAPSASSNQQLLMKTFPGLTLREIQQMELDR